MATQCLSAAEHASWTEGCQLGQAPEALVRSLSAQLHCPAGSNTLCFGIEIQSISLKARRMFSQHREAYHGADAAVDQSGFFESLQLGESSMNLFRPNKLPLNAFPGTRHGCWSNPLFSLIKPLFLITISCLHSSKYSDLLLCLRLELFQSHKRPRTWC